MPRTEDVTTTIPLDRKRRLRRDDGGISFFAAIVTVALLSIVGLVLDGGGQLRTTERADSLAVEASRAAGQAIDPGAAVSGTAIRADPQAAQAAARAYLQKAGVSGRVSLSEDRSRITVTVADTYSTKFLSIVGIDSLAVSGHGSATLLHGVTHPE